MKKLANSEFRLKAPAFAVALSIGALSPFDYGGAAGRCPDQSIYGCVMQLTDPVEPMSGGRPVQMRSAPTFATSGSLATATSYL